MDTLTEIYGTLRDLGHCASQEDFSVNWLGRSRSYYAHLRSSEQRCSISSIGMLVGRIRELLSAPGDGGADEQRRLGAAWIAAKVMYQGEWELLHLRARDRVTAISLPGWVNHHDL